MGKIEYGSIYKVTNEINKKSYIGLTTLREPKDRFIRHIHVANGREEDRYAIHNAIRLYGEENFTFEILECNITSYSELRKREQHYVNKFSTFRVNGYNLTGGGDSSATVNERAVVQIDKITGDVLGKFTSISEASRSTGVSLSGISMAINGEMKTSGGYVWVSESCFNNGFKFNKYNYTNGQPILQINKSSGKIIKEFMTIKDAEEKTNASIGSALYKGRNVAGGFIWIKSKTYYSEGFEFNRLNYLGSIPVVQIDKETNEMIEIYDSVNEASKSVNGSRSSITDVTNGNGKTSSGFKWMKYHKWKETAQSI